MGRRVVPVEVFKPGIELSTDGEGEDDENEKSDVDEDEEDNDDDKQSVSGVYHLSLTTISGCLLRPGLVPGLLVWLLWCLFVVVVVLLVSPCESFST